MSVSVREVPLTLQPKITELEEVGRGYCNNICKRFYTAVLLGHFTIFYIRRLNGSTDILRRLDNIDISKFENGRVRKGLSVTTRIGVISVLIMVVITEILSTSLRRTSRKIAEALRPETPSSSASYGSFYGVSNSTERYATQGGFVSVYAGWMTLSLKSPLSAPIMKLVYFYLSSVLTVLHER